MWKRNIFAVGNKGLTLNSLITLFWIYTQKTNTRHHNLCYFKLSKTICITHRWFRIQLPSFFSKGWMWLKMRKCCGNTSHWNLILWKGIKISFILSLHTDYNRWIESTVCVSHLACFARARTHTPTRIRVSGFSQKQ